jgi:predicted extracellular nuclease
LACDAVRPGELEDLPLAPRLFAELRIPATIASDAGSRFAPASDVLAFWESLESMRVRLDATLVLGATKSYGELTVAPAPLPEGVERSGAGSTRVDPDAPYFGRALVGGRLAGGAPELPVGSTLSPFEGVVDYGFGNYRVLATSTLGGQAAEGRCAERTPLRSDRSHLSIATFNVENLAATSPAERFAALGEDIATGLGGPALLALQEVQDDDGPGALGGPVSSRATLARLTEAIAAAGGPRYVATWIDPEADREGGQPGGNIRVALLSDPHRVAVVTRGRAGALDATEVAGSGRATRLTLSPGRVAPASDAFVLEQTEGVRRSLAVELRWRGRPLFVVVNHWSSKFADDRLFGARQPPRRGTSEYRLRQAKVVRAFADRLLAADPHAALVVLGDFNDVETSPALGELARPPLVPLVEGLAPPDRYSFEFEGNAQLIDHIVVSPALADGAEIDAVHRNADCPDAARSSDHDPLIARLRRAR